MKIELTSLSKLLVDFENPLEGQAYERLKNSIMSQMLRQKDELFQAQKDPDGNAWTPLSKLASDMRKQKINEKTRLKRPDGSNMFADHQILRDTGALMNSMKAMTAPFSIRETAGNDVVVGSSLIYAALQNFGGTITPKNKKTLAFPGSNGSTIFARKVTIPARPFIGFSQQDETELNRVISKHVSSFFGGPGVG